MSEWLKTNRVLMAHALTNHYKVDKSIRLRRTTNQKDQASILLPGDLVLRYVVQPPTQCAKLYRSWKGMYVILEKLDVNTYIVARDDDKRKKFIVHRDRPRLIGPHRKPCAGNNVLEKKEELTKTHDIKSDVEDAPRNTVEGQTETRRSERLKKKASFKHFFNDAEQ